MKIKEFVDSNVLDKNTYVVDKIDIVKNDIKKGKIVKNI